MKTKVKRMLLVSIVFSMICVGVVLSDSKQTSAKARAKVTKTITLSKKSAMRHKLKIDKNEKVYVKVKILQAKREDYLSGNTEIAWGTPDGVKSMKIRITYYTKSRKAGIKLFKQKKIGRNRVGDFL